MSEHRQIVLHGVPVVFPFEPYETQRAYVSCVIQALQTHANGLLESPTGTGKTLSMLCAVLGWIRHKKANSPPGNKFPTVFFSSRTHSQLSQVVREFKRTVYANDMVMAVLGSREHLCVHSQVTGLPGSSQGFQCAQLRADNKCRYFRGTTRYMVEESKEVAINKKQNVNLHDIEDICNLARQENFCPYFYEREMASNADIVFLPYTYIIDKSLRAQLPVSIEDSIVIFDEAHNIPSTLTSAGSYSISSVEIAGAIRDADVCIATLENKIASTAGADASLNAIGWLNERGGSKQNDAGSASTISPTEFLGLVAGCKLVLIALERAIDSLEIQGSNELEASGMYMYKFLEEIGITAATFASGTRHLRGVLASAVLMLSSVSEITASVTGSSGQQMGKVLDILAAVFDSGLSTKDIDESCRFILQRDAGNPHSRTLSFWCLDISVPMRAVCAPLRQVLLTSGTLSPMAHLAAELGVGFNVTYQSNHVINTSEQLRSFILKVGPDGNALNGSYAFRSSRAYYASLGASILNLAVVVPDGMLIFFPSYAAMNSAIAAWKEVNPRPEEGSSSIWGQMGEQKALFVEPPTTAELQTVIAEFQTSATQRKGAILMGVARGKVSEGVDFADKHARCVVVTGIPFANSSDLFVRIKRKFLTSVSSSRPTVMGKPFTGDDWYKNEAMRSVNQCIGRVIRHVNDFGAIILADERFVSHVDALPSWVTQGSGLVTAGHFRDCFGPIVAFFKGRRNVPQGNANPLSVPQTSKVDEGGNSGYKVVSAVDANKALAYHAAETQKSIAVSMPLLNNSSAPCQIAAPGAFGSKFANLFAKEPPKSLEAAALQVPHQPRPAQSTASINATDSANNKATDSKNLIAQLRSDLSAEKYQEFKSQLEQLIRDKKSNSPTIEPSIKAIVAIFAAAFPREKALSICGQFKPFVGGFGKTFDSVVAELLGR